MAAISLLQIHPILLEKIISKLHWRSYFRLQQTCHDMEEFVRTNRNITKLMALYCSILWEKNEDETLQLRYAINVKTYDECPYGVRFTPLTPPPKIEEGFDDFCNTLKKHRITGYRLCMAHRDYRIELTKEQCAVLFKLLKPVEVLLNSEGSNRWEALLPLKQLRFADVSVNQNTTLPAVKQLLVKLPQVKMSITDRERGTPDAMLDLLISILQFLSSEPLPNLVKFNFADSSYFYPLPSAEELLEKLADFNPTLVERNNKWGCTIVKCMIGPLGFCKLSLDKISGKIAYE